MKFIIFKNIYLFVIFNVYCLNVCICTRCMEMTPENKKVIEYSRSQSVRQIEDVPYE